MCKNGNLEMSYKSNLQKMNDEKSTGLGQEIGHTHTHALLYMLMIVTKKPELKDRRTSAFTTLSEEKIWSGPTMKLKSVGVAVSASE